MSATSADPWYERETLPNGIRVLACDLPSSRSVSVAVYVGVGSRAETRENAGIGHFVEHIVFKGTSRRPTAADISQEIESRGGAVNAATDREVTTFWARVPARHYLVALDVIADMLRAPVLRPSDVESEKQVIIEEIRMYRDQPEDRVHALIDELLYPAHPLGWEVAGREAVVNAMTAEDLRSFMTNGYSPERIVVALAGRLDPAEAMRAVARLLGDLVPRPPPTLAPAPPPARRRTRVLGRRGEQAHLSVGWRTVAQDDPDKYVIDMLNAVLGEGMSSRLFSELREKRGLAYDVHSFGTQYLDAGHLAVYAGVAPDRLGDALAAVLDQVARLREEPVPEAELERVRDFAKGSLELRLDDGRGISGWLAGQELFLGRVRTVDEVCGIIDAIGAEDVLRVARRYLLPELAYVTAIGPRASVARIAAPGEEPVAREKIAS